MKKLSQNTPNGRILGIGKGNEFGGMFLTLEFKTCLIRKYVTIHVDWGKNSQIFHFRNYLIKNTILGQNLKKFEISSNFVTLKANIYETMHFQKIFHKDKLSQNGLFIVRCIFLQNKFDTTQNLRQ
jgi:hypothetical protein